MIRRGLFAAAAGALLLVIAAPAALGSPYIQAHRGGSLVEGVPTYGENTLPAFEAAAEAGFVLELDTKLTADGVPVVIHDPALDRTTDCAGLVRSLTAAQLRAQCRSDILGTEGNSVALAPGDPRRVPVPTLEEVLELAVEHGSVLNLEIKNVPTDADFDLTLGFAEAVVDVLEASPLPRSRLIVQSFWPLNLLPAQSQLPGAETSLLTLAALNDGGPAAAMLAGNEWVSPAWPVSPVYVAEAHALGRQVVPYTLDAEADISAAITAGVDAVISNDPTRARRINKALEPAAPQLPPPPSESQCAAARANRTAPAIDALDPEPGAPRVFAMQPKQELRHVTSYESFRIKIECMIREQVVPQMASERPNVVAFNEDIGLMTIATGSRGRLTRDIFGDPSLAGACSPAGVPCAALGALGSVGVSYGPPLTLYRLRFPISGLVSAPFVAATDTFGRGWMQTFSLLAKRYGVYILGSNNQAPFRESRDPVEIAAFADPDQPAPDSVFVATKGEVYNEVFMWGPEDVREEGPRPLRNVVAQNKKVPLTPIEEQLQLTPGPSTGPDAIENLRPFRIPGTDARIGFATSKPAFEYDGDASPSSFGQALAPGIDPCSDTDAYYMRCLDRLGTNLVMQDEANGGGQWPGTSGEGAWQPLEWMRSTWRTAADPTVSFAYNVTPFMVGNLADLGFDGQTSITQRGLDANPGCHYIGNSSFMPGPPENDPARLQPYAGPKGEFLAIVPWVRPDGPRDELREVGGRLAPGSGDQLENDYLETAIVADLPFPPDPSRAGCLTGSQPGPGPGPGPGSGPSPGSGTGLTPQSGTGVPGAAARRGKRRCKKLRSRHKRKRCTRKLRRRTSSAGSSASRPGPA